MTRPAKGPPPGPTTVHRGETTAGPFRKDEGYRDGVKRTAGVSEASRLFGRSAGMAGRRYTYWLVEERGRVRPEVVVSRLADGRRVLPVFGFEEEAGIFVRLAAREDRSVRQTGTDELVSLFRGPFVDIELVALDPLSDAEADMLNGSVSLTRREFLDFLVRPGMPAGRTQRPHPTGRSGLGSPAPRGPTVRGS